MVDLILAPEVLAVVFIEKDRLEDVPFEWRGFSSVGVGGVALGSIWRDALELVARLAVHYCDEKKKKKRT